MHVIEVNVVGLTEKVDDKLLTDLADEPGIRLEKRADGKTDVWFEFEADNRPGKLDYGFQKPRFNAVRFAAWTMDLYLEVGYRPALDPNGVFVLLRRHHSRKDIPRPILHPVRIRGQSEEKEYCFRFDRIGFQIAYVSLEQEVNIDEYSVTRRVSDIALHMKTWLQTSLSFDGGLVALVRELTPLDMQENAEPLYAAWQVLQGQKRYGELVGEREPRPRPTSSGKPNWRIPPVVVKPKPQRPPRSKTPFGEGEEVILLFPEDAKQLREKGIVTLEQLLDPKHYQAVLQLFGERDTRIVCARAADKRQAVRRQQNPAPPPVPEKVVEVTPEEEVSTPPPSSSEQAFEDSPSKKVN